MDTHRCLPLPAQRPVLCRVPLAAASSSRRRPVEHALEELTAAIMLVSSGRFPRVVITNLGHCDEAIDALWGTAEEAGVDLVRITRSDGRGCDVAVRSR